MVKHPRYDALLETVTMLSPKPSENTNFDTIVGFALDKVINDVANYTHIAIQELPEGLDMTIISMCQQFIETHQLLVPADDKIGNVASLSEGDTSVTFKTPAEAYALIQSVNTVTDNFVAQLNGFRVVLR